MGKRDLKIAIQRSGRLSDDSISLLRKCDVSFENGHSKLRSLARNFPLEILFLRDDDIPEYINDGVADMGIVGENILAERGQEFNSIQRLGFGKCRLSIGVPRTFDYSGPSGLNGMRIATSYPTMLSNFLLSNGVNAEVHTISGSVEIAPSIGLADAVCDLVSSGNTLFTNGLKEAEIIMNSEAILIAQPTLDDEVRETFDSLLFRIRAVIAARQNKYVLLNAPNDKVPQIEQLLPGVKSPTVMPLAEKGWSSIHSVIAVDDSWGMVEKLKSAGAEGILVIDIEQMIA